MRGANKSSMKHNMVNLSADLLKRVIIKEPYAISISIIAYRIK